MADAERKPSAEEERAQELQALKTVADKLRPTASQLHPGTQVRDLLNHNAWHGSSNTIALKGQGTMRNNRLEALGEDANQRFQLYKNATDELTREEKRTLNGKIIILSTNVYDSKRSPFTVGKVQVTPIEELIRGKSDYYADALRALKTMLTPLPPTPPTPTGKERFMNFFRRLPLRRTSNPH